MSCGVPSQSGEETEPVLLLFVCVGRCRGRCSEPLLCEFMGLMPLWGVVVVAAAEDLVLAGLLALAMVDCIE